MSPTLARQPRNSTSSCLNHQARQITVPSVASANEFRPIFYFRVSRSVGGLNYSISTHGCTESIISQKNGYIGTLIRLCVLDGQAICLNILVFRMVYVRQGGILSPYMDDLTIALSICDTGCVIGYSNINHLMYADDQVIWSPSAPGLSELMKVCGSYGVNNTTPRNVLLYFIKNKYINNVEVPLFKKYGEVIKEVDHVKISWAFHNCVIHYEMTRISCGNADN